MADPTRRKLLAGAAGLAVASLAVSGGVRVRRHLRQPPARVSLLRQATYEAAPLVDLLVRGIQDYPSVLARARGGRVVLKPNIVEALPGRPINTDARLVAAAVEAFRKLGAAEVIVAEGPGHNRDTELLLHTTGLDEALGLVGARYVDLPHNFNGMGTMRLPVTAVQADLLVSVAKLKCHHWVGATLTLKNLFGTVPGVVYGWPKNPLHWTGIDRSILDLWTALEPGFGIIDGIVAMEGDGPILGTEKAAGVVLMGDQLPALDATAARFMGLDPHTLSYLTAAARIGGTIASGRITQVGEPLVPDPFTLVERLLPLKG